MPTSSPHPAIKHPPAPVSTDGGLYLHWPFCQTKCGYCDFYSVPLRGQAVQPLLRAVERELQRRLRPAPFAVRTIFVGGGTPTTLDPPELGHLVASITEACAAQPVAEFTVEANPATLNAQKLEVLRRAGVNRVSMGAQSFHANELAVLERIHTPADIPAAIRVLRTGGLTNYNLDLIFGVPGQTLESWRQSLQRAIDLDPMHLSCYGLTYEPGTALSKQLQQGTYTPCDEQLEAEMYEQGIDTLARAGFIQYEISNFARAGFACRHNLNYWRNESYVGVGPSAAGYVAGRRYKNVAHHERYVAMMGQGGCAEVESEQLTPRAAAVETIMMQLRLNAGIEPEAFQQRFGIDLAVELRTPLAALFSSGLIETAPTLRLTRRGMLFSDAVITELAAGLDVPGPRALPVIHSGISGPKQS